MNQQDAATRLFDRGVSKDQLRESTDQVAAAKRTAEVGIKSVVIFSIAREWLALPTEIFQEVVDQYAVRTLPYQRSGVLTGLVNVRGDLMCCVALGALLGLQNVPGVPQPEERTSPGRLLICNRKGDRLAFRADNVYGVYRYHPGQLHHVPATLAMATAGAYTLGMLPWNDRTVGCLDDELLFYALNRSLV
jgi:chemotaxis-related protein WspD